MVATLCDILSTVRVNFSHQWSGNEAVVGRIGNLESRKYTDAIRQTIAIQKGRRQHIIKVARC
jgi:hypothetical protein